MKTIIVSRPLLTRVYNLGTGKTIGRRVEVKGVPIPTILEHEVFVKVYVVALNPF
jgi:hypothetical protein